jgi:hypothetical protein
LNGPGQARFNRRGGRVHVVAIQIHPGFKAQRIARAQAGRVHHGLDQQRARQRLRGVLGHRDLEAVLAGVARARDVAVGAGELEGAAGHDGGALLEARELLQKRQRHIPGGTISLLGDNQFDNWPFGPVKE